MESQLESEGKCLFCDGIFSQYEIGNHLVKHLTKMEKETELIKNESIQYS